MNYYPVFLRLQGLPVLIIGGGNVAARKARHFAASGARLTIIAPSILPEILDLADVATFLRIADEKDIHTGWRLVILATDSEATQKSLSKKCLELNIWCNRCDAADESTFVTGSMFSVEPFLGAIISSGSPGLAKIARRRFERACEPAMCDLATTMNRLRERIRKTFEKPEERKEFHAKWETEEIIERVCREGIEKVSEEIEQCLCS